MRAELCLLATHPARQLRSARSEEDSGDAIVQIEGSSSVGGLRGDEQSGTRGDERAMGRGQARAIPA